MKPSTFVLRSSDNALVWVKDMPEKPTDKTGFSNAEWRMHMDAYDEALKQAIENGIKVADEEEIIRLIGLKERGLADLEHYHVFKENDNYFIGALGEKRNKINLRQVQAKFYFELNPDTPYQLDVEMRTAKDMRPIGTNLPWLPTDGRPSDGSMEYRQRAYLVEPKEETYPNYSERDWKEDFPHENGNYICKCCKCQKLFFGHKRRVVCKICDAKEYIEPKVSSPEAESQEELLKQLFDTVLDVKNSKDDWKLKFHITRK